MSPGFKLTLSVDTKNWKAANGLGSPKDATTHEKLFKSKKYTCEACGFFDVSHIEVHHINGDHGDGRPENLATICHFCHLTQHLGLAGRNKEAILIWLPEIDQATLAHVARSIFVAKFMVDTQPQGAMAGGRRRAAVEKTKQIAEAADVVMAQLMARAVEAEAAIGTSDPLALAAALQKIAKEDKSTYDKREDYLYGIRLLPLGVYMIDGKDIFSQVVESWVGQSGAYVQHAPSNWLDACQNIMKSSAANTKPQ